MRIDLTSLFPYQADLDKEIATLHSITYESTSTRRLLALFVELGELANETRCFKFWSLKGPSPKERIVDEFSDGIHFSISIGISLGMKGFSYETKGKAKDLNEAFLDVYEAYCELRNSRTVENAKKAMGTYLELAPLLNLNEEDILSGYLTKCQENHARQERKY